jgi:hypothetical protein
VGTLGQLQQEEHDAWRMRTTPTQQEAPPTADALQAGNAGKRTNKCGRVQQLVRGSRRCVRR